MAAAAINDEAVLANCLARSPDIESGLIPLRTYKGFASAAAAYNQALKDSPPGKILILVHQDVYLPAGWGDRLVMQLNRLSAEDPHWAVAGLVGIGASGLVGRVWSTSVSKIIEGSDPLPARVNILDELLLVIPTSNSTMFDERLPGFHLYGTDIVQEALTKGRHSYVVDAPAVHHDKIYIWLDPQYRRAWWYMRAKWRDRLPIQTLVAPLEHSPLTLLMTGLRILYWRRGYKRRKVPQGDPKIIARSVGFEQVEAH